MTARCFGVEIEAARFKREALILASLNHPNVAAIYGLEDLGDAQALVLELAEGPTLDERLRESALSIAEAVSVAMEIAEALEAAHERGIVHRDLKPANVKLRPDGTRPRRPFGRSSSASALGRLGPKKAVDGSFVACLGRMADRQQSVPAD